MTLPVVRRAGARVAPVLATAASMTALAAASTVPSAHAPTFQSDGDCSEAAREAAEHRLLRESGSRAGKAEPSEQRLQVMITEVPCPVSGTGTEVPLGQVPVVLEARLGERDRQRCTIVLRKRRRGRRLVTVRERYCEGTLDRGRWKQSIRSGGLRRWSILPTTVRAVDVSARLRLAHAPTPLPGLPVVVSRRTADGARDLGVLHRLRTDSTGRVGWSPPYRAARRMRLTFAGNNVWTRAFTDVVVRFPLRHELGADRRYVRPGAVVRLDGRLLPGDGTTAGPVGVVVQRRDRGRWVVVARRTARTRTWKAALRMPQERGIVALRVIARPRSASYGHDPGTSRVLHVTVTHDARLLYGNGAR